MEMEIEDDIRECIEQCQAKDADKSDDLVRNTMSVFTHADKNSEDEETMDMFWEHNSIEIYRHMFFSTAYMLNCFANQDFGSYWFASGTPFLKSPSYTVPSS